MDIRTPLGILCLAALLPPPSALGKTTPGPRADVEWVGPTQVRDDRGQPRGDWTVAKARVFADLLLPIPAQVFGGILIAQWNYAAERRYFRGGPVDHEIPETVAETPAGLIYLPHAAEGEPQWFLLAKRYGDLKVRGTAAPMTEVIAGFDLDALQVPLAFAAGGSTETRVLLRYRRFPHAGRYLLHLEHKMTTQEGYSLSVGVPSHVILGWQTADLDWVVQVGGRAASVEYPTTFGPTDDRTQGWSEGYNVTLFAGVRRRLSGILHLALEVGAQSETMTSYRENGDRVDSMKTGFAPWGKISLETYLEKS